ncbi:MAG TPA: carboxypeptidase regulatory-like domain-containing protein [Candidatus Binataceae bacterium]|nr:carboxypeptidase regulatory-like domain-containing protein [Candidatus Binataceae bacterium]
MKRSAVLCALIALTAFLAPTASRAAADPQNAAVGALVGTISVGGRTTSDAAVSIEGMAPNAHWTAAPAEYYHHAVMDQRDMKFFPRVLPVLVGTTVDFRNDDKVWHNVFSMSPAKKFDIGLSRPGQTKSATFTKPGVVRLLCNVHPTMEAYVVVFSHPYFTSPDARGNYRFEGIPIGSYQLKVWRPGGAAKIEPFKIERAGEVQQIDVNF